MWKICHICLRYNNILHSLAKSDLIDYYNDLCCYKNGQDSASHEFCTECVARLKKCRDFKIQCNLAQNLMNSWLNKQSQRTSIYEIYKDMPTSHLSYCNGKNLKVYFYQSSDLDITAPMHVSETKPNMISNIAKGDNIDTTCIKNEVKLENDNVTDINDSSSMLTTDNNHIIYELHKTNDFDDDDKIEVEFLDENILNDEEGLNDDKYQALIDHEYCLSYKEVKKESDDEHGIHDDVGLIDNEHYINRVEIKKENDEDVKEGIISDEMKGAINEEKVIYDGVSVINNEQSFQKFIYTLRNMPYAVRKEDLKRNTKQGNNRLIALVTFKNTLLKKIVKSGVITDARGNVVDFDKIFDISDKMPQHELRNMIQILSEEEDLNYPIVERLSEVQSKFTKYASLFDIQYLNTIEEVKVEFSRRQEYPDYVMSDQRCEDCFSGFKTRKRLDFHRKILHNPSRSVPCEICKMRFKDRNNLLKHWTNSHLTVYKCKKCPYIVSHKDGMELHYRRHEGIKYKCHHCPAEFNRKNQWYDHIRKQHVVKNANIHCELCAYSTYSISGMIIHRNRMHLDEKFTENVLNKKCEQCDVTFINDEVYSKHMFITHEEKFYTPIIVTSIENTPIKNTTIKKRVFRRKPMNYTINCRLCYDKGSSLGWLGKHFREVHPDESMDVVYRETRQFLCDECGKCFRTKQGLEGHINTHTDTRPYVCPTCARAYHSRHKLWTHMERHEPRKYVCQQCGKAYQTHANLYTHSFTHSKVRSHICEYCGKGFKSKVSLTEHVKGVHMNIRRKRKVVVKPMKTMDSE